MKTITDRSLSSLTESVLIVFLLYNMKVMSQDILVQLNPTNNTHSKMPALFRNSQNIINLCCYTAEQEAIQFHFIIFVVVLHPATQDTRGAPLSCLLSLKHFTAEETPSLSLFGVLIEALLSYPALNHHHISNFPEGFTNHQAAGCSSISLKLKLKH